MGSDNPSGADNQQERLINVIRIPRDHTPDIRSVGWRDGPICTATCRTGLRDWSRYINDIYSEGLSEIPCRVSGERARTG